MKWGHLVNLIESQGKLRQQQSEFAKGGNAIVEQTQASEERKKSKRAGQ